MIFPNKTGDLAFTSALVTRHLSCNLRIWLMNYLSKHGCSRHCAKLLFIEATVTLVASSLSPVRFGQGYRERLTLLSLFSALKATETCVCPRPIIPCVRVGQVRCSQRFQNTDITLAFKWRAEPRKKRQVS